MRVPATVANLGPGFDALGLALDLVNEVEMEVLGEEEDPASATAEVEVQGEGEQELPGDASNRVAQAACLLWRQVRGRAPRLRLRCTNHIPLRSGLGSSAAAAVGGLVAAQRLLGGPLPPDELLALAWELEGHGDNAAPALAGGLTVLLPGARRFLRLDPPPLDVALALPDRRWSTEASRGVLPDQVPRQDAVFNLTASAALVASLALGRHDLLAIAMQDRLHQPHRLPHVPGAPEALEAAMGAGALGAALAGAGPAVVALAPPGLGEAVAGAMAAAFEAAGEPARPLACRPAGEGALGQA
ncbi:homoserine kinase [Limnochorda pilosa]|uniref:Homoserine kinase n=1 Tax=Limnochorda pilosa TaxID=1555112 RepID=A0A0K2SKJ3_LIMPI|nr:homoserine kinase [Limnochorda pilosa]